MKKPTRILIVEDKADDAELAKHEIRKVLADCEFQIVETCDAFLSALAEFQPDVILSDYSLPHFDGLNALALALQNATLTPLIIWTGSMNEDVAVDCMKAGANNYILKDNIKRLGPAVLRALEEKELATARRQAEQKYQSIFENSMDGIFQSSPQGRYLNLNPAIARIYGYDSPEEMIECIKDIATQIYVEPEKRSDFMSLLHTRSSVEHFETRNYRKDGSIIWISTSARAVRDQQGNVQYYEGFVQDITDRKRVEQALFTSQTRYQNLVETSHDLIWSVDAEGRLTFLNRAAKEIYGYEPEELIGRSLFDLMNPDMLHSAQPGAFRDLIGEARQFDGMETRIRHRDGRQITLSTNSVVLRDPDGKLIGVVGTSRDITERKKTEERINDLLAFNEKILNHSSIGILTYKLTGECVFANETAASIVGANAEQLKAQNFDTIQAWRRSGLYDLVMRAITSQTEVKADIHHLSTFGKDIWMTVHCVTFRSKEEDHVLLSITDITERRQAEQRLQQSESRYRLATQATNDVIWEWTPENNQLLWNENARHVFGYSEGEIGPDAKWWDDRIHLDDRSRVLTKINAFIAGNESIWMEEYRFLRRDGSYAYISDRGYIERAENGAPLRLIGAMSDITSRKETEIERQALLEIMQGLANTKDLQELLALVHRSIARALYAENFFVVLHQEDTGLFEEIYSVDQYDPPAPPSNLENSITAYVFRTGEPLLLTQDLFAELAAKGEVKLVGTDSASWLGVPLKTSGRTIGVMVVQDYENENRYSERDRDFLASIAAQIALVIERKRADMELRQKNDDLALLNAINAAVVRGQNLDSIVDLLAKEMSRIFATQGSTLYSTIYMLTPDRQSIRLQKYFFSADVERSIEKLIGSAIPIIEIPIKKGGYFHKVMGSRQSAITSEPEEIRNWIAQFAETRFLPPLAKAMIRKLIPQIHKLLNINSTILVPLISEEEPIGFLEISGSGLFSAHDQRRVENIAGQLTAIIQRQQANEKLRASEERFRLLFENSGEAVLMTQPDGTISSANPEACRIFDRSEQEMRALGVMGIMDPNDARWQLAVRERARTGQFKGELNFLRKNRSAFPGELSTTVFRDSSGDEKTSMIIRDISARKQAEQALRESEEHYRAIFEGVQDAIFVESMDGRILMVNQRACEMFGYAERELLTKTAADLVPVGHPILLADGTSFPLSDEPHEAVNRRANGEEFPIEISGRIQVINGEKVLLVVVRDITERKRAEEALKKAEIKYRTLVERLPVVVYTAELGSNGIWSYVSPQIEELLGFTAQEWMADSGLWYRQIHPEDRERQAELEGQASQCNEPLVSEYRIFTRDGRQLWVRDSGQFLPPVSNRAPMIQGVLMDITERKRAEAAEWEQRALAEALRDTAETLSSTLDYGEVLDHILAAVGRVVPHDAATIMLIEAGSAQVVRSHGYDQHSFSEEIMGIRLLLDETPNLQQMIETRQPVIVYDTHRYPGWKRMESTHWLRSSVGAPISIYGEVIGFVCLDSQTPQYFTPVHAERLEAFANQAALAIHNARLLKQAQEEIAERKQAEDELRASEERFRQLADNIQEGFWMTDAQTGQEIYMSPAVERIWGRPIEQLMHEASAFINSVFPEDRPTMLEAIEKQKSGEKVEIEYRIVQPDGSVRWIWDRAFPVSDDSGKVQRIAGIAADITERKRAEEALRESENKAKALLNALPDLMFRLDREGTILDYKADRLELYAQSEPTLQKKKIREIAPPEFGDLIEHYVLQTLETGQMQVFEYQLPIPERGLRDYEARMVSSGNDEVIAIVRDITEQKRNEAETQRRADEFVALYKTARDLTAQYDLPTLLNTIVERACTLLSAPGGGVYLYDQAHEELEMVLAVGSAAQTGLRLKMGEGMAGRVALNRELIIVDDYHAWEGRSLHYETIPFRAVLEVPMLYGGQLIGVLVVQELGESERKFTEGDAHLLSLFAEYAASAVHAARLIEETRRGAEETSALLKTSLALTNLDLEATLQTIGNSAKTLFTADGCRIFLMEPDGEYLRCVLALQENLAAFSNLRIKIGEGVTGAIASSGQAEIVNEMHNDPRGVQVPGTPEDEQEAIMFAPLKERDRTIGILSIRRAGAKRPFQSTDLELLEAFASMAASAVSNARLFEETQRRLAELEALYENGLAVGRLLQPREIGDRIISTFARYLPWHHVTIRLRKENSDDLELVAFNLPHLREEERKEAEQHFVARVNKVGQGLSGWVIQTGLPLRTGNVHAHPQYIDTHAGIQSGLYMPLKVGERVIGVISVESTTPDAFTEQDARLLATLANQTAIAFENARLYVAMQKELAERKRVEDALRISETHYRALADSITDILFELDQDLHFTHWNKASEAVSGILAQDAIGKSIEDVLGGNEEQIHIKKIYEDVLQSHQPRTFEIALYIQGEKRSFEVNAYPSMRGVSVVAKDVTDRKRAETIMQKRFELMEYSAKHSLPELMQRTVDEVSELTGSQIGFFHFIKEDQISLGMQTWSTNALRLFHVSFHDGPHLGLDQAGVWAEAVRQRRPLIHNDYESLANRRGVPQGHVPIVREIVIPIIRNERIMAVMGIGNKPQDYTAHDLEIAVRLADYAWDITERKQMEIALELERNQLVQRVEERTADLSRANSNLARALRVKDEFLANMSHELRTPLNAILGLSESLAEQIAGPLNDKQQKYISTISESGHHLLSLINDILDLAKIDAGQITLDINKVDIRSVCQASLRMIKQLAQKKNQEVSLDIDPGLGLIWADERRLKQMIVNLLGNAVKFTPEAGKLGLEVHGDEEANQISITVWDHGIGIKEEDLARLFQPFVQLDSGLARETTGTGLGLVLVAQMARLHGGGVTVNSDPGKGSRFTIILPWEPVLVMDSAARMRITGKFRAIQFDETNRPKILLVEDTKEVVMMLKDYLELAGYQVFTAQDGIDGIVQARHVKPELILMDIQMPRMDGFETTRKLRGDPNFRYTPIIALTALAMPQDRERCMAAGMDEYISKPVNLKALVKIIQSCLLEQGTRSQ